MADPSNRTSTPPSEPAYSTPILGCSPRLSEAILSGRLPLGVNGASGSGAAPHAECRLVEVHGVKVASFTVDGAELICLPQVFELFLKHLVGGLHTVYTKLKRLRISPVVCTVEQVRVLRGLGAIQPGVNRCKLISKADFETLYRDCTSASSRPGRPPKRSLGLANLSDRSRLLPHCPLSPALLSQTGLTAAMAEALKMHKMRMMMSFHGNGDQQQQQSEVGSENEDTGGSEGSWEKKQHLLSPASSIVVPPAGSICLSNLQQHRSLLASRLTDLPFMVIPHPLLPVGLPPASVAMAMNQISQLSSLANMTAISQTKDNKVSPKGSPSLCPTSSDEDLLLQEPTSQSPFRASPSFSSSPPPPARTPELGNNTLHLPLLKPANDNMSLTQPPSFNHISNFLAPLLSAEGLSSMETLLTNIQVAVESAHSQITKSQMERKELKLELDKEQDARQTLQRQLSCELQTQVSMQRRLKKEKKAKKKLQEALDFESRRREQTQRLLRSKKTGCRKILLLLRRWCSSNLPCSSETSLTAGWRDEPMEG
ncbi:dachshund homolog 2-like isoform X3 [Girardinichthys multiradiatus]|uniref:dachshund homolog 2-like isoform X3 n=1 Tax=Girardinichthys multiradiatus TaxID=208333 RepID=UPI001FAE61E0|nr:dachshund homolog 2-like isoform X3 [Girardinichthys multiradiatus]